MIDWIEAAVFEVVITVVSGVALTTLFFLVREKLFPLPEIEGHWFITSTTNETAYSPYKGMILIYELMLFREGNSIKGTAEKCYEHSMNQQKEFVGKQRTRSQVNGFIDKRYFAKDLVHFHVVEQGHNRESSTIYKFKFEKKDEMVGVFTSTVAKSKGIAKLSNNRPTEILKQD